VTEHLPLVTKYRPSDFETFLGNETTIAALKRAVGNEVSRPHAFLFTGPSGIGKTTGARIVATMLNAEVVEIDAASNNGVDAMRLLVELGNHMSLTGAGVRMFIIDECHSLSKSAWQAILKMLEEPPAHLYIALCTTELHKVPETIVTRCYHVALRPLKPAEIEDLCMVVAELEGWTVHNDVMQAVIQAATGQPRKALSILQAVHDAPSRDEVRRIITLMDATDPLIALLQYLLAGKKAWAVIKGHLSRIEEDDFEELSIGAGRYIVGALLRAETDASAQLAWRLLDALVFPTSTFDRKASFMAAIGRMIWGNN
jgi:DNA polymerase-3 subunit gamma/tau